MIISEKNKPAVVSSPRTVAFLLLGLLVLFAIYLLSKKGMANETHHSPDLIFCDAENVEGDQFVSNGFKINNGATQSDEQSFSGSYSSKVAAGAGLQFGFGYDLKKPTPGDQYKASVWRFRENGGQGFLVVSGKGLETELYKREDLVSQTKGAWEQIELVFSIPIVEQLETMSIYVYSDGSSEMFFDDLKIEKLGSLEKDLKDFKIDTLRFSIEEKGMQKLANKRSTALRNRILETGEDDWVKGSILSEKENNKKIKLRLKGDWLDHLKGDKWSFRVKMGSNEAWNRLRIFSVQTPAARYFLHEWLLHQFFEKEDVLTTYYDFVMLDLNGESKGVYAVEEHFDKVLLESRQRREGSIIKFREDGFWTAMKRQMNATNLIQHQLKQNEKDWSGSDIRAFGEKAVLSSPLLTEQFEAAQNLMYQFLQGRPVAEVFDVERLAKYYAICDVVGGYHGISWHNQRFYFNPLTAKLEPIGFDGFYEPQKDRSFYLGQGALNKAFANSESLDRMLFMMPEFVARYNSFLYEFSSKDYLQNFMLEIGEELRYRERLLQTEFVDYDFDESEFMLEALGVHSMILPQNNLSLKVYASPSDGENQGLKIANVNSMPLEIIGYGRSVNNINQYFETPQLLPGFMPRQALKAMNHNSRSSALLLDTFTRMTGAINYERQSPLLYENVSVGKQAKFLFFRPLGLDTVFYAEIAPWSAPQTEWQPQQSFAKAAMNSNDMYRVSEGVVYFPKGKHAIEQPLIFPKGYRIHFEAGAQLDLTNQAFFLSNSPIFMYGTQEEPVVITSSDKSGRGFHVMQTNSRSELNHSIFEYLNTVNEGGWTLTGAVTFYEADAHFLNCLFTKNSCEDQLNMIRSEFTLEKSVISETFADGLDSDFCKGKLLNSHFYQTGNDGIDLSGSVIRIENVNIENAGDKGISVGEQTDATIFSAKITGAPIAIAAKDLSTLLIEDIQLINCRQGFTAFQKKPEYGGSKMVVNKYSSEGVKKLYSIQKGCVLLLGK